MPIMDKLVQILPANEILWDNIHWYLNLFVPAHFGIKVEIFYIYIHVSFILFINNVVPLVFDYHGVSSWGTVISWIIYKIPLFSEAFYICLLFIHSDVKNFLKTCVFVTYPHVTIK